MKKTDPLSLGPAKPGQKDFRYEGVVVRRGMYAEAFDGSPARPVEKPAEPIGRRWHNTTPVVGVPTFESIMAATAYKRENAQPELPDRREASKQKVAEK